MYKIIKYNPPVWVKNLEYVPTHRIKLAMTPTPVHDWKLPIAPRGLKLKVKRDDMTGNTLSGNKVRKLEFILAEALNQGCKGVITCGSVQSNHCRATAVASRELGLDCYLFLRSNHTASSHVSHPGNLLLDLFCGSKISFIPKKMQYLHGIKQRQEKLAKQLLADRNEKSICIPIGGSNKTGLYGYFQAWQELMDDNVLETVDDIFITCGSGGSAAGLSIANYLTGSSVKIHAVSVSDDKRYFYNHIREMLHDVGLSHLNPEDVIDIIDGYKGEGYGTTTPEDIEAIKTISSSTGIFLDPVYTWKGLKGLLCEYENNRSRFKGDNVLYIHTGGVFSLYDGQMNEILGKSFNDQVFEI